MKRLIPLILILCLLLCACGAEEAPAADTPIAEAPTEAPAGAPTEAPTEEPVTTEPAEEPVTEPVEQTQPPVTEEPATEAPLQTEPVQEELEAEESESAGILAYWPLAVAALWVLGGTGLAVWLLLIRPYRKK